MAKILYRGHSDDGLMRGEGKSTMMQTKEELWRQLHIIEVAGRICYRSDRGKGVTSESAEKFIRMIMRRGHESVIEHSCLSVVVSNVSRGFTHEMVRHRLGSYSQESTRYVDYDGGKMDIEKAELTFIIPPHRQDIEIGYGYDALPEVYHGIAPEDMVSIYESAYKKFRDKGWNPEDARQFLPIGIASKIAITANFREWRHIMSMRTQKAAHWEIRYIMYDLLTRLKEAVPVVFEDFTKLDEDGNLFRDENGYGYYRKAGGF